MTRMKQLPLAFVFVTLALVGATSAGASTVAATGAAHDAVLAASAGAVAGHRHHHGYARFGFGFGFYGHRFGFGYRSYHHYRPYAHFGYYRPYAYARYGHPYRYAYHHPYGYGYPRLPGDGVRYGAIDLKVKPSKAEVHVDGSYLGVADRFDGFPSYLWLEEGVHKLVFYKEGYRTVLREISVQPGHTVDLRVRLEAGTATAPEELVPPPSQAAPAAPGYGDDEAVGTGPGRLMVSVSPDDAVIYVDGHFFGVAGELAQVRSGVPLGAGEHRVEIVRPGYRSVERTIRVEAGETLDLDATLRPR